MAGQSCEQMAQAGRGKHSFTPRSPVLPYVLLGFTILCKVLSAEGSGLTYWDKF